MINLCIGMRTITVTQLPGGSYSHPNQAMDLAGEDSGIDYWYAMGRWMVIGFFGLAGTILFTHVNEKGDAEPVYCADGKSRVITLALTHSGSKYVPKPIIGKIYENGIPMYEEGMMGQATGNHIHVEVAMGLQTSKWYDSAQGVWRMSGELNPVACFFIDRSFSKVKTTLGAQFRYCDSIYRDEGEGDKMELETGLNHFVYKGAEMYVVKAPAGYKLKMLSSGKPGMSDGLNYIENINSNTEDVLAKANMNYFQMKTGQADAYGQHYGVEYSDIYDYAPKQAGWACFAQFNDGSCWVGLSNEFYYKREQCIFACSPYSVTIHMGEPIYVRSSAAGNKENTLNQQTAYFMLEDGTWCMAVTPTKVYPQVMTDLAKEYKAMECFLADSGGSSQLTYQGQKIVYTGRKIPNVLAFCKPKSQEIPDTGDDPEVEELQAKIDKLVDAMNDITDIIQVALKEIRI